MYSILTILVLGLAAVASGESYAVHSYCIPMNYLNSSQAWVSKPDPYAVARNMGYVTMSLQLTGPEDTLAIKLIGNHPEGKAFNEIVTGFLSLGGRQSKKHMSKDYSDHLTNQNPESKVYSFLPIKTIEEEYSSWGTFPNNVTQKCIPISRSSRGGSW